MFIVMQLCGHLLSVRLEAQDAAAIGLHDEGTAIRLAVLELVRHLLLEVYNLVETLVL